MIQTLNRYYVPVYISNEDYYGDGAIVSKEEQQAHQRIYHEALQEKRAAGSVCVYLVSPEGDGMASLIVSDACQPGRLLKLLEETTATLGTLPGEPLVKPAPQSQPPQTRPGDLLLHLVSRYDYRGSWAEFPAENWLVLSEQETRAFVPPAAAVGTAWNVDANVSARLLTLFFPQTEVCNFERLTEKDGPYQHELEEHRLQARVLAVDGPRVSIRLDGRLRLKHSFYPNRPDDNRAAASVAGYVQYDRQQKRITTLRLVTMQGKYSRHTYTVAVQSMDGAGP